VTNGWRLDITPPARRDLRRLDPPIRRRVLEALDELAADPLAANLVKLTGRPESRLRVGDWRVLVRLDHDERIAVVIHIRPRGRAYDR
jgi:mRNA interferase RelE/StbE